MKINFDKKTLKKITSLYEDGESIAYIAYVQGTHPEIIKELLKDSIKPISNYKEFVFFILFSIIPSTIFAIYVLREIYKDYSTIFILDIRIFILILLCLFIIFVPIFFKFYKKKDKRSYLQKLDMDNDNSIRTFFSFILLLPLSILVLSWVYFGYENEEIIIFLAPYSLGVLVTVISEYILNIEKIRLLLKSSVILEFANKGYNLDFLEKKFNLSSLAIKKYLISKNLYNNYLKSVNEKTHKNFEDLEIDDLKISFSRQKRLEKLNNKNFIKKLITNHENRTVEFKSTFFTDVYTKEPNIEREHDAIKSIAGFLNTYGGYLLIGVTDSQEVIGINNDRFLKNKDKYIRDVEAVITKTLGDLASRFIDIRPFEFTKDENFEIGDKNFLIKKNTMICTIAVESSDIPIYCKHREYNTKRKSKNPLPTEHTFFYVRKNNETIHFELELANKYIVQHFS